MDLLKIDQNLCKRDGLCAAECPTAIIRIVADGFPQMVPGGGSFCLRCGHCVAVCPHGALDHAEVPLAECPAIEEDRVIGHEQAVQFLRSRRSVRNFKDQPVGKETLRELIGIARYAPTASNAQPLEWIVLRDPKRVRAIAEETIGWMRRVLERYPNSPGGAYMPRLVAAWDAGVDAVLRDAPCLVVACAPREAANGMVDLTLALSYLELAAPGLGLGTCWAGLLQGALLSDKGVKRAVGIPDDVPHHYPMMIGYARPRYHRLPGRCRPRITWL